MPEMQITLNAEEQKFLSELLQHALKTKRVEERRTDAIDFRHELVHQEDLLAGLLNKLGQHTN